MLSLHSTAGGRGRGGAAGVGDGAGPAGPLAPWGSLRPPCQRGCADNWLADRYCDAACNVAACGFDAGDCGVEKALAAGMAQSSVDASVENVYVPPGKMEVGLGSKTVATQYLSRFFHRTYVPATLEGIDALMLDIGPLLASPEMRVEEASFDVERDGVVRMVAVATKVTAFFFECRGIRRWR